MAGEIQYFGYPNQTGLTLTAKVFSTGTSPAQVGSDVSLSETGSTAIYTGNMVSTGSGVYMVRILNGSELLGVEKIIWDGSQEIDLNDIMISLSSIVVPTSSSIADAVWDVQLALHTASGSTGEALDDLGTNLQSVETIINTIDTTVDGISTSISGLNDLSAAEVNTQVDIALADYDGPTQAELLVVRDAILDAIADIDGGGGGLTVEEIVEALVQDSRFLTVVKFLALKD